MDFGKIPFTYALGTHTETRIYISFALTSRKPSMYLISSTGEYYREI